MNRPTFSADLSRVYRHVPGRGETEVGKAQCADLLNGLLAAAESALHVLTPMDPCPMDGLDRVRADLRAAILAAGGSVPDRAKDRDDIARAKGR